MKFKSSVKNFYACRINLTIRARSKYCSYNKKGHDITQKPP